MAMWATWSTERRITAAPTKRWQAPSHPARAKRSSRRHGCSWPGCEAPKLGGHMRELRSDRPTVPFAIRGELAIGEALRTGAIVVEDGRISEVLFDPRDGALPERVVAASIVAPGLIDLQVN